MEPDTNALYRQFIARVDRSTIAKKAEHILKDKASHGGAMSVFADLPGGLIGFTLRQLLLDSTVFYCLSDLDKLADRLVEFYGFSRDWVPPRLLVREALAHTVHRRQVIKRIQRELGKSVDLTSVLDCSAATIQRVEDAFLVDDECTDALLNELQSIGLDSGS